MKKVWIFNNFLNDFLKLWAIGFILFIPLLLSPSPSQWWILSLVAYVFIDSGHAYVTSLRTYFKSYEKGTPFPSYLRMIPLLVFASVFIWTYLGIPYLWSAVVYFTFYHNTRQHFGILAWYKKINHFKDSQTNYILYTLTTLPFIAFHFRDFFFPRIYGGDELFMYTSEIAFLSCLGINSLLLLGLCIFQFILKKKNRWPFPVFFSLLAPGILNFICFYFGPNLNSILIPLLVVHGVSYFFLTELVMKSKSHRPWRWKAALLIVLTTAVIGGGGEALFANNLVDMLPSELYRFDFIKSLLVGIFLVPTISHYILDSIVWRSSDQDFTQTLSSYN